MLYQRCPQADEHGYTDHQLRHDGEWVCYVLEDGGLFDFVIPVVWRCKRCGGDPSFRHLDAAATRRFLQGDDSALNEGVPCPECGGSGWRTNQHWKVNPPEPRVLWECQCSWPSDSDERCENCGSVPWPVAVVPLGEVE